MPDLRVMAIVLVAAVALGGCVSSVVVSQSTGLADAGIAYAEAARQVLPLTNERYQDWLSDSLLEELPGKTPCTGDELIGESPMSPECEELIRDFDATQEKQVQLAKDIAELDAQARALSTYFQSLKQLAEYDSATGAANAASRAIDRINGLSDELESKANIGAAQRDAWSGLAGLVGDSIKAARLRERLKADAAAIGRAIDIQDGVLATSTALLRSLDEADRRENFLRNVRTPYLTGTIGNDKSWRAARHASLTPSPVVTQLASLESASEQLRDVWEDILTGSKDPQSAERVFNDLSRALDALNAVRRANDDIE